MALTGSLDELSAAEIVQILALGKKTGTLRVVSGNEESVLYFDEGRAIHAVCKDAQGEEVVFRVLAYEDGYFEYEACEVDCDLTIFASTEGLILEAMRRSDESGAGESPIWKGKAHYLTRPPVDTENAGMLRSYFDDYFNWGLTEGADELKEPATPAGSPPGSSAPAD